jgi:hypothetical protein
VRTALCAAARLGSAAGLGAGASAPAAGARGGRLQHGRVLAARVEPRRMGRLRRQLRRCVASGGAAVHSIQVGPTACLGALTGLVLGG